MDPEDPDFSLMDLENIVNTQNDGVICEFFLQGRCMYGSKC